MNSKAINKHVETLSSDARADIAAGRWDEVMTDALYAACGATTPEEMAVARNFAEACRTYTVISKQGMSPFATEHTIAAAIAASVNARRQGLEGTITPTAQATPYDCDEAAVILGWERDPVSADMDMPIDANIVASDMARA